MENFVALTDTAYTVLGSVQPSFNVVCLSD